jgi:hypothetical protein
MTQRATPAASVNNGGDYVSSRKMLLNHYVLPWMRALFVQDKVAYAGMIYDMCVEYDENSEFGLAEVQSQVLLKKNSVSSFQNCHYYNLRALINSPPHRSIIANAFYVISSSFIIV